MNPLEKSRYIRSKIINPSFLIRMGITANMITALSFIAGMAAALTAFTNQRYFIIAALAHIILDSLDGVVARKTKTSEMGKFYDTISDQLIVIFLLAKAASFYSSPAVGIIAILYAILTAIHINNNAPMLFIRTVLIAAFILNLAPLGILVAAGSIIASASLMIYHFTSFSPKANAR